jgi:hypothetical protein
MLWTSLIIFHHRTEDNSIRFIFFYSSSIFHTIIILSDNKQSFFFSTNRRFSFITSNEIFFLSFFRGQINLSNRTNENFPLLSLSLSLRTFFRFEREKKLHVHVSPIASLSVCIPVVNLLIIENVLHRSQLFRGGA